MVIQHPDLINKEERMKKYSSDRECMIKSFIDQRYNTGLVVRHENGKIIPINPVELVSEM